MVLAPFHRKGLYPSPLARFPGLAEGPQRDPKQRQVLDKELPRLAREGREASGARLPDPRRRDEEAQGREEHTDRQGAANGGGPRYQRPNGDENRDGDLDYAKHGRETPDAQEPVDPTHQRAVVD